MNPTDPQAALAAIQAAAAEGRIEFAPDSLAAALDPEIQTIYETIRMAETGKPPRRPIWASDDADIAFCLPWNDDGSVTPAGMKALAIAASAIGIPLSPRDTWVEAALRLKASRNPPSAKD